MDFEDLLERAIGMFDDEHAAAEFRERYLAFTVDEYQDVNLLQQTLLERWLGDARRPVRRRRRLPVDLRVHRRDARVPARLPGSAREVFRLEENYRSTPQVLALANRLVPKLGGAEKTLRATRPDGPEPEVKPFATQEAEAAYVVERIRGAGCALEEIAILCRTHARLADFEEVLHEAGHPVPGRGAAHARRRPARAARCSTTRRPRRAGADDRARPRLAAVSRPPETSSASARRRGSTISARLVRLAEELGGSGAEFRAELERRFGDGGESRRGVHLLTYHGAKGLEFEVVLLPRLEEKELPSKQAKTRGADRRGAAALLRRADAREAAARGDVGRQAEPVPRPSSTGRSARRAARGACPRASRR